MKQLGHQQVYNPKIPVSEFDGLGAILDSPQNLRYVQLVSCNVRYFSASGSNYTSLRNSSGSTNTTWPAVTGQALESGTFYIHQCWLEFYIGNFWQSNFTPVALWLEIDCPSTYTSYHFAASQNRIISVWNYPAAPTAFVSWSTVQSTAVFMGQNQFQTNLTGTLAPYWSGTKSVLVIPLTAATGVTSFLEGYASQNPTAPYEPFRRLFITTKDYTDGVAPTGRSFMHVARGTLHILYSV